jgi:hypothetical protein
MQFFGSWLLNFKMLHLISIHVLMMYATERVKLGNCKSLIVEK